MFDEFFNIYRHIIVQLFRDFKGLPISKLNRLKTNSFTCYRYFTEKKARVCL